MRFRRSQNLLKLLQGGGASLNPAVCGGNPHGGSAPRCFWIESSQPTVIGYHWLAFLNPPYSPIHQEFWAQNQPYLKNQKSKNRQNKCKICFRTLRTFWDNIFLAHFSQYSKNFNHNSKNKNRKNHKIVFLSFSTLHIFYSNMTTFEKRGGGERCLHIVNWDRRHFDLVSSKSQ